jgi:hypothetical protein
MEARSLDGKGNHPGDPGWGEAGTQYLRVATPNYADGLSETVTGPRDPSYRCKEVSQVRSMRDDETLS